MSFTKTKVADILKQIEEETDYDMEYLRKLFGFVEKPMCKAKTKMEKPCTHTAVEGKDGYCTLHFNKHMETVAATTVKPAKSAAPADKPKPRRKAVDAVKVDDSDEEEDEEVEEAPAKTPAPPKVKKTATRPSAGREIKPKAPVTAEVVQELSETMDSMVVDDGME